MLNYNCLVSWGGVDGYIVAQLQQPNIHNIGGGSR
jgi:hypothetical protein